MMKALVLAAAVCAAAYAAPYNPSLNPIDFGADASGGNDSTAAFAKLLAALLTRNMTGGIMSGKVYDMQGATIDLQGGQYLLSQPFAVPNYIGNWRMIDGSLHASQSFPPDRWLVEVGDAVAGCPEASDPQYAACGQDVSLSNVLLNGGGVAAGALQVAFVMGMNVGPDVFLLNFTQVGVNVIGGHEVMLHQTWIGQQRWQALPPTAATSGTAGGAVAGAITRMRTGAARRAAQSRPPRPAQPVVQPRAELVAAFQLPALQAAARAAAAAAATTRGAGASRYAADGVTPAAGHPTFYLNATAGIVLGSNDHYVSDSIVFSGTRYGAVVFGAANLVSGLHCWNDGNPRGVGIADAGGAPGGGNRYEGVYMDYNDLVAYNPQLITVTGAFFLCGGRVVLAAEGVNAPVSGVTITANQFSGTCGHDSGNYSQVVLDLSNGTFTAPVDVTVRDNIGAGGWQWVGSRVSQTITTAVPTTTFVANFSQQLLFPTATAPIRSIEYSLTVAGSGFATAVARPAGSSAVVTVDTDAAVTGSVTITVDQSVRNGAQ